MTRTALTLTADGVIGTIDLDGPEGSLKTMQTAVGGLIEPIDLNRRVTLWVNEEGKLGGFEPNPIATAIFIKTFDVEDVVMGDVIFTGGTDDDGQTMALADNIRAALVDLIEDMLPVPEDVLTALREIVALQFG